MTKLQAHKAKKLKYKGKKVYVDKKIVPLILWCWNNDIHTNYCCQGYPDEGIEHWQHWPNIVFSSLQDLDQFLAKLSQIIPHFTRRVCGHWTSTFCIGEEGMEFAISCRMPPYDLDYILSVIKDRKQ